MLWPTNSFDVSAVEIIPLGIEARTFASSAKKCLVRSFSALVLPLGVSFCFVALAVSTASDEPETRVFPHVLLTVAAGAAETPATCEEKLYASAS